MKQTAGPTGSFTGTDTATQRALFAGWNASSGAHRWQISGRNDDHSQFDGKHTYALAYGYQLTDALRAQLLRIHGYRADVVEFVASQHTPRNTLLRAVRTGAAPRATDESDYLALVETWRVQPKLAELLA